MGTKMAAKVVDWFIDKLHSEKNFNNPHTAVMLGVVSRQYKFTPVQELKLYTDFTHRIPVQQWWLKLRPLLRILAKHESTYIEEGMMMSTDDNISNIEAIA